jgi:TusA-related sulfurtransferase
LACPDRRWTVEKRVDARGLACPKPVILTRDAIRAGDAESIRVTVDGDVAAENVRRMAESQGWEARLEREGGDVHVFLAKRQGAAAPAPGRCPARREPSRRGRSCP